MYRDLATANVVTIITALVVGYFFLEPPWRWLILIPAAFIESLDIIVWLRWRKARSIAGAEGLIGSKGRIVSVGDDDQVTVKARGTLWRATAEGNVLQGDEVVISGVDSIRLRVRPALGPAAETPQPPR